MKKVAILCIFGILLLMGCAGCSDPPTPPIEEPEFFPLTYQFLNKSDTTIKGGFDIRLAAYYPKKDSSHYRFTGLNNPAVGYHLEETFTKIRPEPMSMNSIPIPPMGILDLTLRQLKNLSGYFKIIR